MSAVREGVWKALDLLTAWMPFYLPGFFKGFFAFLCCAAFVTMIIKFASFLRRW